MQHASSNPSSFVVWCRRQYVEASNSQTVEVLGLTDLTVFIPAHPTEIVQFVDGNFTTLLQIPRDETSKKLVPCGQLGSECFMKFSLSVLHLIILKHVFLISHTSLQVNYCRIVEGQLEHWPLTQNVMLVLFLFVQSGHIASNLVPHLDSAWGCKVNFLDPSWGKSEIWQAQQLVKSDGCFLMLVPIYSTWNCTKGYAVFAPSSRERFWTEFQAISTVSCKRRGRETHYISIYEYSI